MDTSTTVMLIAALVTLVALYWKSPAAASDGLNATSSRLFPVCWPLFTLAGLIQAIVPQELIVKRMGHGRE
jgi:hypothetical protein